MIKLLLVIYEFFKIGLFAVGGGLATLPFLYNLSNIHPDWLNNSSLLDMVAISESTPGALGVNMATYVGYTIAKIPGGILSTLGLVAPSVIIIVIVAKFLDKFKDNPTVDKVFYGIRPASIGLIVAAGFLVIKEALLNVEALSGGDFLGLFKIKSIIFAVVLYIGMTKFKIHPIWFILISAVVGNIIVF
ncbi:MAG: chromate transporter [Lachnospirales bacterium]